MARISQETISRLRMLSCESVAEQLGIEVRKHKALCFMHEDHHPSLSFFGNNRERWNCFVWNFSITPAISCPMPKPCTTISRQKKNRTCLRSCPFHPNTILSPMKPSSMLCSTSRRTRPARSPCAKAGRRKSSMTSSPAKASWASSSYPT